MKYQSLQNNAPTVDFHTAVIAGQAPDKGLYFPTDIPQHGFNNLQVLKGLSKQEIGYKVMKPFVSPDIPETALQKMIEETLSFEIPLVRITENIYTLELFHGPTLAFKDIGARFMSRCLGFFSRWQKGKTVVLVATSGDTGGAVADGFYGIEGVDVVILFPSGKVSPVQEWQLTTYGNNIHALEVKGDFDDCQAMVKQAFVDPALTKSIKLTSANSINIARWLPQQLYYFQALQQWEEELDPVISVPSGNFGNLCAGLLAWAGGLPVRHFIAACNSNDAFTRYLDSGIYRPCEAIPTLSNAMDVGNPSNFSRLQALFGHSFNEIIQQVSSVMVSDAETLHTMYHVFHNYGYCLDPHGAVGFHALQKYLDVHPGSKGIFLETAHPVKFPDVVEKAIGVQPAIPDSILELAEKEKRSHRIENHSSALKAFLMDTFLS